MSLKIPFFLILWSSYFEWGKELVFWKEERMVSVDFFLTLFLFSLHKIFNYILKERSVRVTEGHH